MNHKYILLIYTLFPLFLFAQKMDTLEVKYQTDSLIKVSRELTNNKNFEMALETHKVAEKLVLEHIGKETSEYGSICFNYGRIMYNMKNLSEAEKWYLDSKIIREKILGKMHLDYAWSLNNLALLYGEVNKYSEAEAFFLESKAIREKLLGKINNDYANTLNNLGSFYWRYSNFDKAEPIFLELINIREKLVGRKHPEYCGSIVNMAFVFSDKKKFIQAETLLLEAKYIFESELMDTKHPYYFNCLNCLALVYENLGNYEKAEATHLQNLEAIIRTSGKGNSSYLLSLANLANIYNKMGNYENAEKMFLETSLGFEKTLGKDNFYYAQNLYNLASLYHKLNLLDNAEKLVIESMEVKNKIFGNENLKIVNNLTLLGMIYTDLKQFEKAESFNMEALKIIEKNRGKNDDEYYWALNNLATNYAKMRLYEKAETLLLKCIPLTDSLSDKKDLSKAICFSNLAEVNRNLKRFSISEAQSIQAINLLKKDSLYDDQYATQIIQNLVSLYLVLGQFEKASTLILDVSNMNKSSLLHSINHLSENEITKYMQKFEGSDDILLSLASLGNQKQLIQACFDNSLFLKGILLNSALKIKNLAGKDSTLNEILNQLKATERRLGAQYALPSSQRNGVQDLEKSINSLEKELAFSMAGYKSVKRQINWHEIEQILKKDEATIEFVKYNYYRGEITDSILYAALILRKGFNEPLFIPLFEEKSIDSLLKTNIERNSDFVNHLYSFALRGFKPITEQQRSLYDLIWHPMQTHLQGVKRIYYSASGLLHRINLNAIPLSESEALGDRYQLIALNSSRQLVIPGQTNVKNQEVVLYGGINYETDSTYIDPTPFIVSRTRGELPFQYIDSTLRGGRWNYLPGTEREILELAELLKSKQLKVLIKRGSAATEESFKNIGQYSNSPRVLHVSTHGYFFPDPKKEVGSSQLVSNIESGQESMFKISEHPMLRSGLILAGGNAGWQSRQMIEGKEDGVLTAYEISQMNLSNTELVVLSACETGLGDIKGNEGVYGLQRAFKIAGAKYLIMSLWQIPDRETTEFMLSFYKNWLKKKKSIPEAFRQTQKEMRERFINPFSWAGFVLVE